MVWTKASLAVVLMGCLCAPPVWSRGAKKRLPDDFYDPGLGFINGFRLGLQMYIWDLQSNGEDAETCWAAILQSDAAKRAERREAQTPRPTEPTDVASGQVTAAASGLTAGGAAIDEARVKGRLYVLNTAARFETGGGLFEGASVDFLDGITQAYEGRVPLDADLEAFVEPQALALSDDGERIVVAVRGSDPRFDPRPEVVSHLAVVDVAGVRLEKRINLPLLHRPVDVALSPDGALAYVSALETADNRVDIVAFRVFAVDISGGNVVADLELPKAGSSSTLGDIVTTPDGLLLAVRGPSGIHFVDTTSWAITATVDTFVSGLGNAVTNTALHLAMHPHGTELYVADARAPQSDENPSRTAVGVIDVATATLTDLVRVPDAQGGTRQSLGISADGLVLSHIDSLAGKFTLFDARTHAVIDQFDLGNQVFQGSIATGP